MDGNKQYWNNIYESKKEKKPIYDLWLDKYKYILDKSKEKSIIDLGCGSGVDSLYLMERGYKVIACDYSEEASSIVNKDLPIVEAMKIDISKTLPFEDESIEVIIADLSLHYFNDDTTKIIVKEIKRKHSSFSNLFFLKINKRNINSNIIDYFSITIIVNFY